MANISRNTFDKLKHYVNVRMQQGVPLVDADWNEKDDIRKHELELFLKWYVGNGVPKNNDGFRILPRQGIENDFIIKSGENGQPGICLVDGWEVRNENDTAFTGQSLFDNDTLAQEWEITPLTALTLPTDGERTDLVYLDVWEREVNGIEDPELVNPAINTETCVRMKREWVVRVAEGTTELPSPVPEGHVFYPLATIKRTAGQAEILQEDITDLRNTIRSMKEQDNYSMPTGGIIMWSGSADNIPQGWALCDGANGTPDLRGRFILSASNTYNPGSIGGSAAVTLTETQMPAHTHNATQPPHNHNQGNYIKIFQTSPDNGRVLTNWGWNAGQPDLIYPGELQPATPVITVENTGNDEPHENMPPYYALCFIMKL